LLRRLAVLLRRLAVLLRRLAVLLRRLAVLLRRLAVAWLPIPRLPRAGLHVAGTIRVAGKLRG